MQAAIKSILYSPEPYPKAIPTYVYNVGTSVNFSTDLVRSLMYGHLHLITELHMHYKLCRLRRSFHLNLA